MIKAQKLAGFRDFFAPDVAIREYVINTFKGVFEKYGYEPLETPALEYTEIFSGEAGSEAEKLFYSFKDKAGRSIMLKYEVMIAMCRAVAENINNITFPYKRYQIQTVWRAESPQKGRFREFTQCDADTIGSDSVIWDAEFIQMGNEALKTLGFSKFQAKINNRKLLFGIVKWAGAAEKDFIPICLSIDKLPKIGRTEVEKELLQKRKISPDIMKKILDMITLTGNTKELISIFKQRLTNITEAQEGIKELETIFDYLETSKVDKQYYQFTPFIARGLAYYTGPIWEFDIAEGNIGSVAGCGRYDNTIGRFLGRKIPATGGSFGIERICQIIKDRKMIDIKPTTVNVLVTIFNKDLFKQSLITANQLRNNNIATMIYSDLNEKLDKQIKYADKKQIPYVVIIGPDEAKSGLISIKNLSTGQQQTITTDDFIKQIK